MRLLFVLCVVGMQSSANSFMMKQYVHSISTKRTLWKLRRSPSYSGSSLTEQHQQRRVDPIESDFGQSAAENFCHAEISSHYRQDKREHRLPGVSNAQGLTALLEQRHAARNEADYIRVSNIDARLKKTHGVVVYDHPPIWSRLLSSPPPAVLRQQAQKQTAVMQRAFGATGHPYQHASGGDKGLDVEVDTFHCDVTITDIHALLSRYTRCRLTFQQEEADAALLELTIHGVRVNEASKQWTTDPFFNFNKETTSGDSKIEDLVIRLQRQGNVGRSPSYARDPQSQAFAFPPDECARVQQRIEQLVLARSVALQRGERSLAASLTFELLLTYNLGIDDATMTWTVGGKKLNDDISSMQDMDGFDETEQANTDMTAGAMFPSELLFGDEADQFASSVRYSLSNSSHTVPKRARHRIESLVQERIHKREEGKFLEADAIRRELWRAYVRIVRANVCERVLRPVLTEQFSTSVQQ